MTTIFTRRRRDSETGGEEVAQGAAPQQELAAGVDRMGLFKLPSFVSFLFFKLTFLKKKGKGPRIFGEALKLVGITQL